MQEDAHRVLLYFIPLSSSRSVTLMIDYIGVSMGRKTILNKDIQTTIVRLLKDGNTDVDAFTEAGIAKTTFYNWLNKGEEDGADPIYVSFKDAVTRARVAARKRAVSCVKTAIIGTKTVETVTETMIETRERKDGSTYEYKQERTFEKIIRHPGDWRAAIELLKRRDPEHWSEKVNQDIQITVESGYESAADAFERLIGARVDAGPTDDLD